MQNSNKSEKSRGAVIFAFNSLRVDYVKIAERSAKLIKHFLQIPVTVVTDSELTNTVFDQVIKIENKDSNFRYTSDGKTTEWRNFGRHLAYELTPYEETILLDTDYFVLDSNLNKFWSTDFDYKIVTTSNTPDQTMSNAMGHRSFELLWATVVMFRKTKFTQVFFDFIGRVQKNYAYYYKLFNLTGPYRNDFAFAIADLVINGYTKDSKNYFHNAMLTIEQPIKDIEIQNNLLVVRESQRAHVIPQQNMHIMDKDFLMSDNCVNFVERIVSEST